MAVSQAKKTEISWQSLSPDQKMDRRFEAWLAAPGVKFATPEAEANYKACVARYTNAIRLKKTPDRVPVQPSLAGFAIAYCGYTEQEVMYDVDKAIDVATRCTLDFQIDGKVGAGVTRPGKMMESIDFKQYSWPGHGVPEDGELQFNEGEYMKEDEYDAFLDDPSDFWWRTYLPRTAGAFEPFTMLSILREVTGQLPANLVAYGRPEVQAALNSLMEAGSEMMAWQQKMGQANRKLTELGFADAAGGSSFAPFDKIGDWMRGTRGIVKDMFRQPDKLLTALDRVTPWMVKSGVAGSRLGGAPIVGMPLHKGADGFMSDEHFEKFYWPGLRNVILGLVEEGLVPSLFAEGGYNTRLEIIRRDMPRGKTIWYFDYTDMAKAKDILGDVACIRGNVPVALIDTGTPEQTEAYCRDLIKVAGKGGGFILSTGAGVDKSGKVENVRAMINAAKKYGVY